MPIGALFNFSELHFSWSLINGKFYRTTDFVEQYFFIFPFTSLSFIFFPFNSSPSRLTLSLNRFNYDIPKSLYETFNLRSKNFKEIYLSTHLCTYLILHKFMINFSWLSFPGIHLKSLAQERKVSRFFFGNFFAESSRWQL